MYWESWAKGKVSKKSAFATQIELINIILEAHMMKAQNALLQVPSRSRGIFSLWTPRIF